MTYLNGNDATRLTVDVTVQPKVRVVSTTPDPFAGLTGHAYLRARNLDRPVERVQTSARFRKTSTENE